ncbi:SRPBCC family protein [Spongiimicrobium sp. 3-5]|uniref:SRPBCC family protein n=1 Tax=Spongiimicrobium sp. 3-5 TaxID=3332596 RepID=UPI00397FCCDC
MTTTSVYVQREFECTPKELFRWISDPNSLAQWFGPKQLKVGAVEMDVRVGGTYSIELLRPDNTGFYIKGHYTEIEQDHKLTFTFEYYGIDNKPPNSLVKIYIEEITTSASRLSLEQKFVTMSTDMENRSAAWRYMMEQLHLLIK